MRLSLCDVLLCSSWLWQILSILIMPIDARSDCCLILHLNIITSTGSYIILLLLFFLFLILFLFFFLWGWRLGVDDNIALVFSGVQFVFDLGERIWEVFVLWLGIKDRSNLKKPLFKLLNLLGDFASLFISKMGYRGHLFNSLCLGLVENADPVLKLSSESVTRLNWLSNSLKILQLLLLEVEWSSLTIIVDPLLSLF